MAEQLYLNDVLIELPPRSVARTLQANNFASLADRQTSFSNNINIPLTANNIKAMENLGIMGDISRIPYKELTARYVLQGIEMFNDGIARVKRTRRGQYQVAVYDNNISLKDALGDLKLNDLDYSDYNHVLTNQTWLDSLNNEDGYIYAITETVNNTRLHTSPLNFIVSSQVPCMFQHTLFDMIFDNIGFTYSGSLFNQTEFKNKLISTVSGLEASRDENTSTVFDTSISNYSTSSSGIGSPSIRTRTVVIQITETGTYRLKLENLIATFRHNIDIPENPNFLNEGKFKINFFLNNDIFLTLSDEGGVEFQSFNPANSVSQEYTHNELLEFVDGDRISIQLQISSYPNIVVYPTVIDYYFNNTFNCDFSFTKIGSNVNIPVNFENIIGDKLQFDFIKDIMIRYNLLFTKDPNSNNYRFIQVNNLLQDFSNAEDWSNKLSSTEKGDNYRIGNYSQNNIASYNYDNTDDNFSDGILRIDNINLRNSGNILQSIFTASERLNYIENNDIFRNTLYSLSDPENLNSELELMDSNNRIFTLKRINLDSNFLYKFTPREVQLTRLTLNDIPFASFDNLSWQHLIDTNYDALRNVLNNSKVRTLDLNLSVIDIYNLDFFRLKYFKQFGEYYYLQKITNYMEGSRNVRAEFIKIPTTAATETPLKAFQISTETFDNFSNSVLCPNWNTPKDKTVYVRTTNSQIRTGFKVYEDADGETPLQLTKTVSSRYNAFRFSVFDTRVANQLRNFTTSDAQVPFMKLEQVNFETIGTVSAITVEVNSISSNMIRQPEVKQFPDDFLTTQSKDFIIYTYVKILENPNNITLTNNAISYSTAAAFDGETNRVRNMISLGNDTFIFYQLFTARREDNLNLSGDVNFNRGFTSMIGMKLAFTNMMLYENTEGYTSSQINSDPGLLVPIIPTYQNAVFLQDRTVRTFAFTNDNQNFPRVITTDSQGIASAYVKKCQQLSSINVFTGIFTTVTQLNAIPLSDLKRSIFFVNNQNRLFPRVGDRLFYNSFSNENEQPSVSSPVNQLIPLEKTANGLIYARTDSQGIIQEIPPATGFFSVMLSSNFSDENAICTARNQGNISLNQNLFSNKPKDLLDVGDSIYTNSSLTTPLSTGLRVFNNIGTNTVLFAEIGLNGLITRIQELDCDTVSFSFSASSAIFDRGSNLEDVCETFRDGANSIDSMIYSNSPTLQLNSTVFLDSDLTQPIDASIVITNFSGIDDITIARTNKSGQIDLITIINCGI